MTILDDRAAKAIQEAMDARVRALSANHPTTHMAEVIEVDQDGITWVHVFGGADRTPAIRSLAKVKKGDLVTVTIEEGVVTINGSSSNPAATVEYVEAANYAVAEYAKQAIAGVLGDVLQVKNAIIEKATIEDLTAVEATIQTLTASYASINELVTGEFTAIHASIDDLEADNVTVNGKITAAEGRIDVIESDYITTADMEAEQARVGTLLADYAEIDLANVNNAWINNGVINKAAIFDANVFDITGQTATISEINAATINVTNLHTSNLTVDTAEGYVTIGNKRTPTKEFIDSLRDELQQEIDGAVETFTVDHVPLLLNSPATDWALDPNDYDTTEEYQEAQRRAYARHVGDIAYVTNASLDQNGYCYRFAYDSTAQEFKWVLIKDSDVTKALSDISDLQTFESETATWINETDQGLETIRTNHTTLSGVVDKTVKKSVQLWYTKANTTAPNKPTSQVTSTSTSGNAWRVVVPAWNASYPNYYYCWQYELADGTFAWSDVVRDIAMGESQSTSRNAQTTANSNIKSSVMLWFTKADDTAPNKPSSAVTTNNPATGNAWNLAVPTYNSSYPHYFYCYQQQKGDGTYQWTDVVYDRATSETQSTARAASSSLANYISTNDAALAALQSQVDGQLDVWYGAANPTVGNAPASDWDTEEKASHVGDLYYNTTDGSTWQWTANGSLYSWTKIPDFAAAAALSAAQDAQATADGKRRIFTTTPTVPYDVGDLWVNGDEVKYATVAKTSSQSYSATDWAQTATDDTAAAAAQETANANIKSSVQLWFTKANSTAPNKPTAVVTTNNSSTANTWNIAVPTYNSSYPHYFYCYQQQKGDNTYQWTDVVYDKGTTEAMEKAQAALPQTTFTTFQQTTFKDVKDTVDEQSSTITTLTSIAENNGLTENTNLTNTVNTVQQTANTNTSNISSLQTITTNNGLTSSTNITNRVSSVEQDLNGYKTTVSQTYATQEALSTTNGNVTAAQTDATNALNKQVAFSATSSTGATTAAKVASCTNFPTLAAGATVTVRFSTANTSTGAITLNVNSTGAKTVYVNGAATSSTNQLLWATNANITFTYDGTYWRVDSEPRTWYGTGGVAAATAAKTATINEIVICKGTTVVLNMTYENTNESATLNVASTGAKNIYYGTTTTRPTTANGYGWAAASTVSLVFDGAYWRIGDTTSLKRITTAESSITQTATSITSLVANNDTYTAPDGTTKTNTIKSAIKQNADAIDLRVEKSGVIAAINLTSETAKIQASKVEIDGTAIFNSISSNVDSAITSKGYQTSSQVESAITSKGYATTGQVATAKSEAISSANSTTDTKLASYSTTTQMNTAISTAVDNIDVGGRNLLLGTGTAKTSSAFTLNSSNYAVYDFYSLYAPYNQIAEVDGIVTVSFDWSCTSTGGSFHVECGTGTPYTWGTVVKATGTRNATSNYVDVSSSNVSGHVSISFKATQAHVSAADTLKFLRIRVDGADWSGKTITLSNAKAEKGNIATDWTPALEDMSSFPIASRTYTGLIGTSANNAAECSFYFAKVHPTVYTAQWRVKLEARVTAPTAYTQRIIIEMCGDNSNFRSYNAYVSRDANLAIYYINLYRATSAGINTNHKGHALGVGLRASTNYSNSTYARTVEIDILEADGCTVEMLDTAVKYANMDGTGSTNYAGLTEMGVASNGQNATNNANNYDRVLHNNYILAAAAVSSGKLACGTASGYIAIAASATFDLSYPILWAGGAWSANTKYANAYEVYPGVNPATTGTVEGIAINKQVYLKGAVSGNTFTCASSNFLTCNVPTSEQSAVDASGNRWLYIPLGVVAQDATTKMFFTSSKDLYAYIDGKFRQVTPTEILASQYVYIQAASGTMSVDAPDSWVEELGESVATEGADSQSGDQGQFEPVWTTKRPTYNSDYPLVYVAIQHKRLDGTVSCTIPLRDDSTTIIDGGHITTGVIDASKVSVTNLNASNITSGTIDAKLIDAEKLSIKFTNVDGLSEELNSKASTSDVQDVQGELSKSIGALESKTDNAIGELSQSTSLLDERVGYFEGHFYTTTVGEGAASQPAFVISADGNIESSGLKTVLTNSSLMFQDGGQTVAQVTNQELDITRTKVTESMQLGNFMWIPLSDGSLAFKWIES